LHGGGKKRKKQSGREKEKMGKRGLPKQGHLEFSGLGASNNLRREKVQGSPGKID